MSTEKFFVADPYNDNHIMLYSEFEEKHGISATTSSSLIGIRSTFTEEEYTTNVRESNEIHQNVFLQGKDGISDCCHIQGEKDMKSCRIFFAPLQTGKNRKLLHEATTYAFDILGMEDIFVTVPLRSTDQNLLACLETAGFESLGEVDGNITYLKEKEEIKEFGRAM